jgi:GDP-D-mannose dehydratase
MKILKVECKNFYSKFRINSSKYLLKIKKNKKINATIVILFNHDSKYRNKKFLFPRLINSIKKKRYLFLKRLYKENISGDFSHAHDICNAIFLLIEKNKNPDKIILSSGKRTYINHIIDFFMPKFKLELKKLNLSKKALIIGNNKKAVNLLNWKIKKNSLLAAKELFRIKKIIVLIKYKISHTNEIKTGYTAPNTKNISMHNYLLLG